MDTALELTVTVLAAMLAIALVTAFTKVAVDYAKERAVYRNRRRERDDARSPKPVDTILADDWDGPPINPQAVAPLWNTLAAALEISPQLMRPTDLVADIMVSTDRLGPDSLDLIEWIMDHLPGWNPESVLEEVAHDERETVGELIRAILTRQSQPLR